MSVHPNNTSRPTTGAPGEAQRTEATTAAAGADPAGRLPKGLATAIYQLLLLFGSLTVAEICWMDQRIGGMPLGSSKLAILASHVLLAGVTALVFFRFLRVARRQLDSISTLNRRLAAEQAESQTLALVASHTNNAVILTDPAGNIAWVNRGFTRITDLQTKDVLGKPVLPFLAGRGADFMGTAAIDAQLRGGRPFHTETRGVSHLGRPYYLSTEVQPVHAPDGTLKNYVVVQADVTAIRHAEAELRRTNRFLDSVIDNLPDVVFVKDLATQRFVRFNRAGQDLFGMTAEQLQARASSGRLPSDLREMFVTSDNEARFGGSAAPHVAEHEVRTPAFGARVLSTKRVVIDNPEGEDSAAAAGQYLLAIAEDVTERRAAEDQLRRDATHDPLTQLPNRQYFLERLSRCIERRRRDPNYRFGVLFLDLDRFKLVNDSLGHSVGDLLLLDTARKLVNAVRATIPVTDLTEAPTVARLGGDEFTILVENLADPSQAASLADAVLAALRDEPFRIPGHEVAISASVGVTTSDAGYEQAEDVVRDADIAMYRAKSAGRNRQQLFDRSMHASVISRLTMENDLRRALDAREFQLHYQPIVSLDRPGAIEGFEALIRWNHPTRGFVSPADFIRVAEETGLILPIGNWVLAEACRQLRAWNGRFDSRLTMSVNLSRKQLADPALLQTIDRVLEETGINPAQLNLELTETMIMESSDAVLHAMEQIRSRGIGLHLDDFGTGYSSLSCLHRFPITALKIDRAFVNHLTDNPDYVSVVDAIVSLAHNLRSKVVAEGIETPDQMATLRRLGCDFAQGYFFYKPMAPAQVESLLAHPKSSAA